MYFSNVPVASFGGITSISMIISMIIGMIIGMITMIIISMIRMIIISIICTIISISIIVIRSGIGSRVVGSLSPLAFELLSPMIGPPALAGRGNMMMMRMMIMTTMMVMIMTTMRMVMMTTITYVTRDTAATS